MNLTGVTVYPVTVTSLSPATNHSLRTAVVYPNGEQLYSDPVNFTTTGMCVH